MELPLSGPAPFVVLKMPHAGVYEVDYARRFFSQEPEKDPFYIHTFGVERLTVFVFKGPFTARELPPYICPEKLHLAPCPEALIEKDVAPCLKAVGVERTTLFVFKGPASARELPPYIGPWK